MTIRKFSGQQLQQVYCGLLPDDFPPAEIKPYAMIQPLIACGLYAGYGYYEQDELRAYALFAHEQQSRYLLLDYFAVRHAYRSGGYGGRFLRRLGEYAHGYQGLLGEIENIDFAADEAEADIRRRRLVFYQNNGWRLTGLRARLYGVEYSIIAYDYGQPLPDGALSAELSAIYRLMFKPSLYRSQVHIYPPEQSGAGVS